MADLLEKIYNPDVLTCLANLSSDEVFTPPEMVSQMLDRAMELAIELPLYQRENVWAYNTDNLNMDTVQKSSATWDFTDFLWQIEMN